MAPKSGFNTNNIYENQIQDTSSGTGSTFMATRAMSNSLNNRWDINSVDFGWGGPDTLGYPSANTQMGPTMANQNALSNPATANAGLGNLAQQDYYKSLTATNDIANANMIEYQNSFMGQAQPYISGFAQVSQGLGSLASIYTGFKGLDLYEDQVGIAKEQWAETKSELNRVKGVRTKLNTNYMS